MTIAPKIRYPLAKFDPFRSKSWRWDRVLEIVDHDPRPLRCKTSDDAFVRAGRDYLLKYNRATEATAGELFREYPGLFGAHQIYLSTHHARKDLFEARILAQQSPDEIALETGTFPSTIEWYEKLFFNVNDRLRATDWIIHEVLAPSAFIGPDMWEGNEHAMSLKFFAWVGGPVLLDFMLTMVNRGSRPNSYDKCAEFIDSAWADTIKARSLKASRVFRIHNWNVQELFAVHTRIIEIQRATDTGQQSRNTIEKSLTTMLAEMPFLVGRKGARAMAGTALGELDKLPVETRDDELFFLCAGEETPKLADYTGYQIPDAPEDDGKVVTHASSAA